MRCSRYLESSNAQAIAHRQIRVVIVAHTAELADEEIVTPMITGCLLLFCRKRLERLRGAHLCLLLFTVHCVRNHLKTSVIGFEQLLYDFQKALHEQMQGSAAVTGSQQLIHRFATDQHLHPALSVYI